MNERVKCEGSGVEGVAKKTAKGCAACPLCRFIQPFKRDGSVNDIIDTHYFGEGLRASGWIAL